MKQVTIHTDEGFRTRLATDSRQALTPIWRLHEEDPTYPKKTVDVLLLLASMGWDCTAQDLDAHIAANEFKPPRRDGDLYSWQAQDIARLIRFLDKKRCWQPGFHQTMKTAAENRHDEIQLSGVGTGSTHELLAT